MADIFGLPVEDLPDGWQPVEAILIIKCLKPNGSEFPYGLCARITDGMSTWEAAGMASWAVQNALAQLADD